MVVMSASQLVMHTLTGILHSDSLKKMMDLPKPRSSVAAIQAKLDSLKKASNPRILDSMQKPKKNLDSLSKLEVDVFDSDDIFSED